MPVDRSSQGLAQVMLEKNAKVSPVKSAKARQTSEPAGIPISPTLIVKGVRNDLSNLGGALIGGFSEVTGLKLKKKPGFDLPILASLNLGMSRISEIYNNIVSVLYLLYLSFMVDNIFQDPKVSKKLEMTKQNSLHHRYKMRNSSKDKQRNPISMLHHMHLHQHKKKIQQSGTPRSKKNR